jgi:hypothetical protein
MKNLVLTLMGVASMVSTYGQDLTDALRYSTGETEGTARFKSMSGAFGALGGDMSAVSINPAGSAIFNLSHGSMTIATQSKSNAVLYGSNTQRIKDDSFDMTQIGATLVFNNRNLESGWNKFVISLFYEQLQSYFLLQERHRILLEAISQSMLTDSDLMKLQHCKEKALLRLTAKSDLLTALVFSKPS